MRPRSPLIPVARAVRPAPHTAAELAALLDLLRVQRPRIEAVTVGHGRDPASVAAAGAFADAWTGMGLHVLAVVDWPEEAASWLRQARRMVAGDPDAWVVAAGAPGWAQMSRRLRHSTAWRPERTFGFASAARGVAAAGPGTLLGLRGATAGGEVWEAGRNLVTVRERRS
ncbi:hypothetical protein DP939_17025 [Spongiactinospora rosea]|uniref:Leucine-binding protein domain-containing protein n=1 Tax=Spongiactinospora rosea TaxID=2248750 RepID=A0A366LYA2_9ACTN|nr:hypothetical protein [Spongiactinospora rosea]RBQ18901.1 hypothetical protein DP939_17025 [Spongiactinospora rosea]